MTMAMIFGMWAWLWIAFLILGLWKGGFFLWVLFGLWTAIGATFVVWAWVDVIRPRKIASPHGLIHPPSNVDLLLTRKEHPEDAHKNPDEKTDEKANGDGRQ